MPTTPDLALWLVRSLARLAATFAILQGASILFTSEQRWAGDGFRTAMQLPGAPPSWGWFLLAGGLCALFGSLRRRNRAVILGLYACATWALFFALGFIASAARSPMAATTGIGAYLFIAALMVVLAEGHRRR